MWGWYPKAKRRRPADGLVARTGRGEKFGQTWWAGQWLAALERLMDPGRLTRGRSYARGGQVLNIDIGPGEVKARVQGSQATPYKIRIEIQPLADKAWNQVVAAMAAQAIFAAKLLAGEMPANIEEAFATAGASLFPAQRGDLVTSCSCPDWANPCKHVAAVYYLLGEQFDDDPFLIFKLRGWDKAKLLAALRAQRMGADPAPVSRAAKRAAANTRLTAPPAEKAAPLAASLTHFWAAGDDLSALAFTLAAPEVAAVPVKQLGAPPFWIARTSFSDQMSAAYTAVTQAALALEA